MSFTGTIPFYANTKDDTHCYQAAFRSVLKYFYSSKQFTWKQLDLLTGKKKGLWTWPMVGLMNLKEMGLEVISINIFDYQQFADHGGSYLLKLYGEEKGNHR